MLLRSMTIGLVAPLCFACFACSANTETGTGTSQAAISGDSADAAVAPEGVTLCDPTECGDLPAPPLRAGIPGAGDGDGDRPKPPLLDDGGTPPPPPPPPPFPPFPPPGGPGGPEGKPGGGGGGECGGGGHPHGPPMLACVQVEAGKCEWRPVPPPPRPEGAGPRPGDDDGPKPPMP